MRNLLQANPDQCGCSWTYQTLPKYAISLPSRPPPPKKMHGHPQPGISSTRRRPLPCPEAVPTNTPEWPASQTTRPPPKNPPFGGSDHFGEFPLPHTPLVQISIAGFKTKVWESFRNKLLRIFLAVETYVRTSFSAPNMILAACLDTFLKPMKAAFGACWPSPLAV